MKNAIFSPLFATALFCSLFFFACQKETTFVPTVNMALEPAGSSSDRCMCLPPYTVSITDIGSGSATIIWDEMPESIGYRVEWVLGNNPVVDNNLIMVAATESNSMQLTDLKPNRQYGVRIINICRLNSSNPAAWTVFNTAPEAVVTTKAASVRN